MQLPRQLISSLEGIEGFDKEAFEKVHALQEPVTSIRINPAKWPAWQGAVSAAPVHAPIAGEAVPWSQYGYYLKERPSFTFDPFFHAGCYYVQEASSMFLEQALKQAADLSKPVRVLDLCAAPGGKSTHIASLLSENSLLVSNEVIRSRAAILKENIIKWGSGQVVVTNNDPKDFAKLEDYFDVIVVDAPCSGSGLFRKDEEAIGEWSESNVQLCSHRQRRILADVWPALKKGGLLVYATCSYSSAENEEILKWTTQELQAESLQLRIEQHWNITEVQAPAGAWGYRFWPYQLRGEGFFMGCFRKTGGGDGFTGRPKKILARAGKKEKQLIAGWVKNGDYWYATNNNIIYGFPGFLTDEMDVLLSALRVQYSGIVIGEIFGDQLVPAHSLAMSGATDDSVPQAALDYTAAIRYLQKKDIDAGPKEKGWHLVSYSGHPLGWIKVLGNRINNYYPKELRILKDI